MTPTREDWQEFFAYNAQIENAVRDEVDAIVASSPLLATQQDNDAFAHLSDKIAHQQAASQARMDGAIKLAGMRPAMRQTIDEYHRHAAEHDLDRPKTLAEYEASAKEISPSTAKYIVDLHSKEMQPPSVPCAFFRGLFWALAFTFGGLFAVWVGLYHEQIWQWLQGGAR